MSSGVCGGTEEIWNPKQLLLRVCTSLGSEHPTPREIGWLEQRVGYITVGLQTKIGKLDEWLEKFHGVYVLVSREADGSVMLSLTSDGAAKYAPTTVDQSLVANDIGVTPNELAVELRGNVFEELRKESEKRRASGNMFIAKSQASSE